MENNYMPEGSYDMFCEIYRGMLRDFNNSDNNGSNKFINGFWLNYGTDHNAKNVLSDITVDSYNPATGGVVTKDILRKEMSTPADYGDVMVCQVLVNVNQPTWGWVSNDANNTKSSVNFQNDRTDASIQPKTHSFVYTYYVPCLKYQSVTQ